MSPEIRVLRTLDELEQIRSRWKSWSGNRDSHFDFFLTLLRANKETVRPHVIVAYRNGQPDAILVGRLDRKRMDFRIGYTHLRPTANVLYFAYGALRGVSSDENCGLLLQEVCRSLSRGEADVAYLNFLDVASPLYKLAKTRPGVLSRDYVCASQPHYSMAISTSVEEFHGRFSPKVRKNQKWQAKKLEKDFCNNIRIRCFRDPSEVLEMMEATETIARKSYQRGLGVGFVHSSEMRQRMQLKAERGWLRAYVLYVGELPCAFWIGDINESTFGSEYLGYDPEFAKYSPGMYLINRVIEGFCKGEEGGLTQIDFASGDAQYKELLSTCEWNESAVHIFALSLKGIKLNAARCLTGFVDHAIKRSLAKTQLLQKVKKAWRNYATQQRAKADATDGLSEMQNTQ